MAGAGGEVVLLDAWMSVFGMRARIALAEKGIEYEYKEQNLFNKGSELLQMNPIHKKVPVLVHKGKPICESLIILQYIDDVWKDKGPTFLPSDPYLRAQARFWAAFVDTKVYDVGKGLWTTKGEDHEVAVKNFIATYKQLEETLGDKPYFGGDTFGFVDIALIPFYSWVYTYDTFGNIKMEQEFPKYVEWGKRCMQKESVSKSLADQKQVYDFAIFLRKKFGLE